MRLYREQLGAFLQKTKPLPRVFLISSISPTLIRIATQRILETAQDLEILRFFVDRHFDWATLVRDAKQMDFFNQGRAYILNLFIWPNTEGQKALKWLSQNVFLIVTSVPPSQSEQKQSWFQSMEKTGVWVRAYPPNHVPAAKQFILERAACYDLELSAKQINQISEVWIDNVDAIEHLLQQLQLLPALNDAAITALMHLDPHFQAFTCADALLTQKAVVFYPMLQDKTLHQEPGLLLGALYYQLTQLKIAFQNKQPPRTPQLKAALSHWTLQRVNQLLGQLCELEVGLRSGGSMSQLMHFLYQLAGAH